MELYRHSWNLAEAKASIVLIHGTGEHHGRYAHVAVYLNEHGYNVVTGDLPGWGRSPGLKGHITHFGEYVDAVEKWITDVLDSNSAGIPIFVLGHSLGGLIAARFVQRYDERSRLAGLILTSPCVRLKVSVPAWKVRLAQMLNQVWPTLRLPNGIEANMVTRESVVREAYQTDPLNYPKVSVRWFNELNQAIDQAWQERNKLDIPLLVLQAGDDCLVDPVGVEAFVQGVPALEKQFTLYPDLYHEVMNEPERETVLENLVGWLDHHVEKPQI